MSPGEAIRNGVNKVLDPSPAELITETIVVCVALVCATALGLHGSFNSGDLLAVFTAAITGRAAVAGARAGNRQLRSGSDSNGNGG